MSSETPPQRIGVVGTGFVARHFTHELRRRAAYRLGRVLTRRPLDHRPGFPPPDDEIASVAQPARQRRASVWQRTLF